LEKFLYFPVHGFRGKKKVVLRLIRYVFGCCDCFGVAIAD
jgi:hypothetical protein